jgi:hypothetical protein
VKGHGTITVADRKEGIDDIRQEIQGKPPKGPFEFASSLEFVEIKPGDKAGAERTFRQALYRDALYASAGPVFLRAFGMSQAMRELYDGSKQLRDAGIDPYQGDVNTAGGGLA